MRNYIVLFIFSFVVGILLLINYGFAFNQPSGNPSLGTGATLIRSGANIGIGIATPGAALHVVNTGVTAPSLTWGATAGQIFRNEASELAIGLSGTSPWPLWLQGRTSGSVARDIVLQPVGGNVGIGTTTPGARLDVTGTIRTTGFQLTTGAGANRILTSDAAGVGTWVAPTTAPVTSVFGRIGAVVATAGDYTVAQITGAAPSASPTFTGNVTMPGTGIWDSAGNVGIGTASPATRLDVAGTARMTGFQLGTTATAGHVLTANASGVGTWAAPAGLPTGTTGQTLRNDGTSWVANSVIFNNGTNVGIGTTSPENAAGWARVLDVSGVSHSRIITRTGAIRNAFIVHEIGFFGAPAGGIIGTETNHPLSFITNSAARMMVSANGNVGIGTTSPTAPLTVVGNIIASSNVPDGCAWRADTCNNGDTCGTNQFMVGVERMTGMALCGVAPTQWYRMRLNCCAI